MGLWNSLFGARHEPQTREIDTAALSASEQSHLIWAIAGQSSGECTLCEREIRSGSDARASIATAPGFAHADCFINEYGEESIRD